jgi:cyclopropane-fatty-acyl-phospholipid synthase
MLGAALEVDFAECLNKKGLIMLEDNLSNSGDISRHAQPPEAVREERSQLSRFGRMIRSLLHRVGDPAIQFVLWNGERIATSREPPIASVTIKDRVTLFKIAINPDVEFGEAYSAGTIDVNGDLTALVAEIYRGKHATKDDSSALRILSHTLQRTRSNTLIGSRDNIHHHYDIGNEFYSLWLGATMAYTCAYYPTSTAPLDEAQVAKMHHVCRKLRLRSGESVVEAGCGWGSFALHMARHYGVKVRAFNISREQIAFARERAKREGLEGQVEYIEDDYRNVSGRYDAFVSVGMLEHVGVENYPDLGRVIDNCLDSSGRGLIHSIGRNRAVPLNAWITRRIFPGAYPPPLREMMHIFEAVDHSVLDVENLRLHYARTLQGWRDNFERSTERIAKMFDEKFVRMWRLYLAGSEAAFLTGDLQLFQVLFAPRGNNDVPWTREHLYK